MVTEQKQKFQSSTYTWILASTEAVLRLTQRGQILKTLMDQTMPKSLGSGQKLTNFWTKANFPRFAAAHCSHADEIW